MPYVSTTIIRLGSLLLVSAALAGVLVGREAGSQSAAEQELSAREAVMLEEQGRAIIARHREELLQVPGVNAVVPVPIDGKIFVEVFVYTNDKGEKPPTLPPEILALPTSIEGLPLWVHVQYSLPPPPGVLVVKPGGVLEQADVCPPGYEETRERGWRFCNSRAHPETIPPIMVPPIAGIPYVEALEIMRRHREELMALPGVDSVGMGKEGISVQAADPSVLPKEVEGLPLEVHPRPKWPIPRQSHTTTTPIRPVGGALSIRIGAGTGTLTGVLFSCGMWLVFPAHLNPSFCTPSPCMAIEADPPIDECLNRYSINNPLVCQPRDGACQVIGQVVHWTPFPTSGVTFDVAAAWMDNDFQQGNNSLCADRHIETLGNWTGEEPSSPPGVTVGDILFVYGSLDPHQKSVVVDDVDVPVPGIQGCNPGQTVTYLNQLKYHTLTGFFQQGDSGAPVLTGSGRIVAMHQWGTSNAGGGILAQQIRSVLGFSTSTQKTLKWYGTTTFPSRPQVCQ